MSLSAAGSAACVVAESSPSTYNAGELDDSYLPRNGSSRLSGSNERSNDHLHNSDQISPTTENSAQRSNAKQHWNRLRAAVTPVKMFDVFELFGKVAPPVPYAITIHQGIQHKYTIASGVPIVCAVVHERLILGGTKYNIVHLSMQQASRDREMEDRGDIEELIDSPPSALPSRKNSLNDSSDAVTVVGSDTVGGTLSNEMAFNAQSPAPHQERSKSTKSARTKQAEIKLISLARTQVISVLDAKQTVHVYDISRGGHTYKLASSMYVSQEVTEFITIEELGAYIGCAHDQSFKIFDMKFEHVRTVHAWRPVMKLFYDAGHNFLITVGINTVTLEGALERCTVDEKFTIELDVSPEAWINHVVLEKTSRRLYLAVGSVIFTYSYSLLSAELVERADTVASRQITSMIYHEPHHYLIIGLSDGTIKLRNTSNIIVHEFIKHFRAVRHLIVYSDSLLVSWSADCTMVVWNLTTFRDVYSIHLKEDLVRVNAIDKSQLWMQTPEKILVWSINMLNRQFSQLNSTILSMQQYKTAGLPARLVVSSDDGLIRLIAPTTGKVLTSCIPMLQSAKFIDITYSPKTNRLYFLLSTGDIWIAATDANPCVVIETWKLGAAATREDCSCICIFEGLFPKKPQTFTDYFTFLLGGTRNGQIIFYGHDGSVRYRCSVHSAAILNIVTDVRDMLIATICSDNSVRLSKISPLSKDLLEPRVSINLYALLTHMCISDGQLVAVTEEGQVFIHNFNLRTGEHKAVPQHPRQDDHTEPVAAVSFRKRLGIYVTVGADGNLKVWDTGNALIREVAFDFPLRSVCVSNSWGDLLVCFGNRIDLIKYSDYLPSGYVQSIDASFHRQQVLESPISFDHHQDIARYSKTKNRPSIYDKHNQHETLYNAINLQNYSLSKENEQARDIVTSTVGLAMDVSSVLGDERGHALFPIALTSKQRKSSYANVAYPDETSGSNASNVKGYARLRRNRDLPSKGHANALADVSRLLQYMVTKSDVVVSKDGDTSADTITDNTLEDNIKTISPNTKSNPNSPTRPIVLASDGRIPNSVAKSNIKSVVFAGADPTTGGIAVRKKKDKAKTVDEKLKQSAEYKARLQRLLAMVPGKPKEEAVEMPSINEVDASVQNPAPAKAKLRSHLQNTRGRRGPPPSSLAEYSRPSTIPSSKDTLTDQSLKELSKTTVAEPVATTIGAPEEPPLPRLIQKALEFKWLQDQQIFNMQNENGQMRRGLAVEPTADGLLPLMLSLFQDPNCDVMTRKEVAGFINWLNSDYGFKNSRHILTAFCDYLHRIYLSPLASLEQEVVMIILEEFAQFGANDPDVIMQLLLHMICGDPVIEAICKKVVLSIGLHDPDYPPFRTRLEELVIMGRNHYDKTLESTSSQPDVDINRERMRSISNFVLAWIRRVMKGISEKLVGEEVDKSVVKKKKKKNLKIAKALLRVSASMEELQNEIYTNLQMSHAESAGQTSGVTEEVMEESIINALNRWIDLRKKATVEAERLTLEADRLRLEKLERQHQFAERILADQEYLRTRDAERLAKQERMRQSLDKKKGKMLPRIGPGSIRASFHPCHPSRETIDYNMQFPPVADNLITAHLLRLGKTLPLELVHPRPFARSTVVSLQDPNINYTNFTADHTSSASTRIQSYRSSIIGSTATPAEGFATRKKYFMPKLDAMTTHHESTEH